MDLPNDRQQLQALLTEKRHQREQMTGTCHEGFYDELIAEIERRLARKENA
ncbi:hypothetical protein KUW19_00075 [Ferrimonas balearica]|uniref:hypothetical protein n=1 Tax=Ferrimonas balearica TaxID=44012 RepID=UPI001C96629E|nr:hypothetical protein [Ferrimonas balearica]MBY6104877.1 hypothetical protein [Ferrimonas balearica]